MNAAVIDAARGWLHTPFKPQLREKGVGCDCLQFLAAIYEEATGRKVGRIPPYKVAERRSRDKYGEGLSEWLRFKGRKLKDAEPGDALLLKESGQKVSMHSAVLTDCGTIIHCSFVGGVIEIPLTNYYMGKIVGVYEFPEKKE